MKLNNLLLVTKQTELEYHRKYTPDFSRLIPEERLKVIERKHKNHYSSLHDIEHVLSCLGISYDTINVADFTPDNMLGKDAVISVGGDGTFLTAAYEICHNILILPVKSDASLGALCIADALTFRETIDKILSDNFTIDKWDRLEARFNGTTRLALNEAVIGPKFGSGSSRYNISVNGLTESQEGSGILVATGTGSTGRYRNVGTGHLPFPRASKELRFLSLDALQTSNYSLLAGVIDAGESLVIRSDTSINGTISFDGDNEHRRYDILPGTVVKIRLSDNPLRVIVPDR